MNSVIKAQNKIRGYVRTAGRACCYLMVKLTRVCVPDAVVTVKVAVPDDKLLGTVTPIS